MSVSASMKTKKIGITGDLEIHKDALCMHASELIERGICLENGNIGVRTTGGSEHIDSNQLPLTQCRISLFSSTHEPGLPVVSRSERTASRYFFYLIKELSRETRAKRTTNTIVRLNINFSTPRRVLNTVPALLPPKTLPRPAPRA